MKNIQITQKILNTKNATTHTSFSLNWYIENLKLITMKPFGKQRADKRKSKDLHNTLPDLPMYYHTVE